MTALALEPRKSPRQQRSRATIEVIVEAAARVLETVGPEGFNTNAVARRAGVSVGSLYQYFPGKQALIAELSRRNAEAVLRGLTEVAARTEGLPLLERLTGLVAFAIAQQSARPQLSRVLDQLEPDLRLDTDAAGATPAISALLVPILADGAGADPGDLERIAGDCLALVRALIDRALDRGLAASAGLEARLVGALAGYLRAAGVQV